MSFDPTKPVRTKMGDPAEIVDRDFNGKLLAIVTTGSFNEKIARTYHQGGKYLPDLVSDYDLINVPGKHVRWVNFYEVGTAVHRSTRQEADEYEALRSGTRLHRIACIRVEFEDGEGLP